MKITPPLNWKPVVASLFQALAEKGFIVNVVNNGGDDFQPKNMQEAIDEATASDEAEVWLTHHTGATNYWIQIVLGNAVCETVSDFGVRDTETGKLFEQTIEQWSDSMEGVECPHEGEYFQGALKDVVKALEFVHKYAAMRETKGDALPSQLTDSVSQALAKAKGFQP